MGTCMLGILAGERPVRGVDATGQRCGNGPRPPRAEPEDDMGEIRRQAGAVDVDVLEGDEGELEVGRQANVGRQLLLTQVREVMRRTPPVTVRPDVTVE